MTKELPLRAPAAPPVPLTVLILWIFGGTAFALIVYVFTPFTHNLDDLKVAFQYSLAPIVWAFFAVALYLGYIRRVHPVIVLSLAAFMLVMLLATLLAAFPWRAWHDLAYQLTVMAPFLVVVGTTTNDRRFRNMCLFYYLIGVGTILFGLFHYFGGIGYIFNVAYPGYPDSVPSTGPMFTLLYTLRQNGDMLGTILNRDFYSAYLIMILPMGVAMAIDYKPVWVKVFFLMSFFLGCVCLILAFSKDSYVALALTLVVFLVLFAARHEWRSVSPRMWAVWILGAVLVLGTALFVVRERIFTLGEGMHTSVMSRKVIWGGSWNVFLDYTRPLGTFLKYLLIGGGPGAFYLHFPEYRHPDYNLYQISHITIFSHNQYLDLTAEEGLLGFLTFTFFLGAIIWLLARESWRRFRHPLNVYQIMLLSSILGVSFQNTFSPGIRWTVCGFAYYYLLGLAVNAFYLPLEPADRQHIYNFYEFSPGLKKALKVSFLAFTLVFMAISVPYGWTYFLAAKTNNDGLITLDEFGKRCDAMGSNPKLLQDPAFVHKTREVGYESIRLFNESLEWEPDFITGYYKLAHVYSRMATLVTTDTTESERWWKKAKATYDTLAGYAPHYSEIHQNYGILGRVFYQETRNPECLVEALRQFHQSAKMSNRLSVQETYMKELQEASQVATTSSPLQAATVAAFEPMLRELNPPGKTDEYLEGRLARLRELINKGDIQQAATVEAEILTEMTVRVAERLPSLTNSEGPEGDDIVRRGRMLVAAYCSPRGRYAEAMPALTALLREDPENPDLLNRWVMVSMQAGQPRQCLEVLAELIARNPINCAARQTARRALEQIGDYRRATEQAMAVGYILAPMKRTMPELFDSEKGATMRRQMGDLPTLVETYWWVATDAEKAGDMETAYNYCTKAVQEDPKSEWARAAQNLLNRLLQQMPLPSSTTPKPTQP